MTRGDFVHGRRDESLFDMVFRCVIFFFLIQMFVQMMKFCFIVRKRRERRRSLQFIHGRGSASVIIFGASQPEIRPRILRKLTAARLQIEQTAW